VPPDLEPLVRDPQRIGAVATPMRREIEGMNDVVVGAFDKAGDEASLTSDGPTVALPANGYQVESVGTPAAVGYAP
jgi:hypothetical protein